MPRTVLRNDHWNRIQDLLPGKSSDCGVTAKDNRKFLEAVLWIARTGAPWRDLSKPFGNWHRVYVRYNRWCHKGTSPTWSTRNTSQHDEAVGKSRGGLTTKIHAAVDALGSPVSLDTDSRSGILNATRQVH